MVQEPQCSTSGDNPVDSETPWWLRQSRGFVSSVFEDTYRSRVCVHVFLGLRVRALRVSALYCVKIRKKKKIIEEVNTNALNIFILYWISKKNIHQMERIKIYPLRINRTTNNIWQKNWLHVPAFFFSSPAVEKIKSKAVPCPSGRQQTWLPCNMHGLLQSIYHTNPLLIWINHGLVFAFEPPAWFFPDRRANTIPQERIDYKNYK